jgi:nitroreductase
MTNKNMPLFDAIYSQRAIRHFSAQPVSDEAVETMLNAAIHAPSGGNRQPWRFVVMWDAALKRQLGQWYLAAWQAATAGMEVIPDRRRSATHPHPMQGYRFQRITATYRWFLTFPPHTHLPQARTPLVLTWRYETPPIAEMALPWALERTPRRLPEGFHEAMDRSG